MQDEENQEIQTNPAHKHFNLEGAVFVLLVILSLLGIVITDFNQHDGYSYWSFMVVVFGMLSIFVSWLQAKTSDNDFGEIVKDQGLHWLHTLIVVGATSLIIKSGHMSEISASLVILLILGLATMLDGMRIGWQFTLVGFFLVICATIVAYVEQFIFWCISLGVLVVAGTFLWGYWFKRQSIDN